MTADAREDAALPRWAGITEPMTVLTNVVLSGVALVLGARLGYAAAAVGSRAQFAMALAMMATAVAAIVGAAAHGSDPVDAAESRQLLWRLALYATGFVGAATIASVAFFAARGTVRAAILWIAAVKVLIYLVAVARRPEFRVAAADYGSALGILLAGAAYAGVRWAAPATPWITGGVLVSLVAGLVQARRMAPHRHFNHNDVYHVIQLAALYMFYRGGALLVDR